MTNAASEINKFRATFWNPPKGDPLIESYISFAEKKVLTVAAYGKSNPNLSPSELSPPKILKSGFSLIIKEVYKWSAIVVWDRGGYITIK